MPRSHVGLLADPEPPRDPDGWPTSPSTPHPGGPTGPRYPALAEPQRVAARVAGYGRLPGSASARPPAGWEHTCLGPFDHRLGVTCLHRVAESRLSIVELCEGCTRRLMDALTSSMPDLPWAPAWWRRAGLPEGGPS